MHRDFEFSHMFLFGGSLHWIWPLLFWVLVIVAIISAIKWFSMK